MSIAKTVKCATKTYVQDAPLMPNVMPSKFVKKVLVLKEIVAVLPIVKMDRSAPIIFAHHAKTTNHVVKVRSAKIKRVALVAAKINIAANLKSATKPISCAKDASKMKIALEV
jgi:hypothetical protein